MVPLQLSGLKRKNSTVKTSSQSVAWMQDSFMEALMSRRCGKFVRDSNLTVSGAYYKWTGQDQIPHDLLILLFPFFVYRGQLIKKVKQKIMMNFEKTFF